MSSNDKSRQRKRARTAETLTNLTSDEIAALSPADTARLLTRHEHGVAGAATSRGRDNASTPTTAARLSFSAGSTASAWAS